MSNWTTIPDTDTDADSPLTESLLTDMKENCEYLFETAVRSGMHGAPHVRTALARGFVEASYSGGASDTGWQEVTITYATDSLDGDPNFSGAPALAFGMTRYGGTAWGATVFPLCYVKDGTQTASGCTLMWRLASIPTSGTFTVRIYYLAQGQPSSGE